MKNFATYEKSITVNVVTTRHTIRVLLNSDRRAIEDALSNVPYSAKVTMVVDDAELGNYGEIVFIEEKSEENK